MCVYGYNNVRYLQKSHVNPLVILGLASAVWNYVGLGNLHGDNDFVTFIEVENNLKAFRTHCMWKWQSSLYLHITGKLPKQWAREHQFVHRASLSDRLECIWMCENRWSVTHGISKASGPWSVAEACFLFLVESSVTHKHRGWCCLESFVLQPFPGIKIQAETCFSDLKSELHQ